MKKIISILLTFVLVVTLVGGMTVASSAASSLPDYLRVGMKTVSPGTSFTLESSDGFKIYRYNDGSCSAVQSLAGYSGVNVVASTSEIIVKDMAGNTLTSFSNTGTDFIGCSDLENGKFNIGSTTYRGGLMFYKGSAYEFINVISLEKYLYGVVPAEMYSSFMLEALKAQAVAARCYAATNVGKHASLGFDVCTTTHCQAYKGVSGEVAKCSNAASETTGKTVQYDNRIIECNFSKNNGGYIESSKSIWGSELPYYAEKADPYTPDYNWSVTYTKAELESKLASAGLNVGSIVGVSIIERSGGGAVLKLAIMGSQGSITLEKTKISSLLGSGIKSLHFDISNNGAGTVPSDDVKKYILGGANTAFERALASLYVINGEGKVTRLAGLSNLTIRTNILATTLAMTLANISAAQTETGDAITFVGKGYGHGVGMSQDGANAMATQGFSYDEILKFYYTGTEVK